MLTGFYERLRYKYGEAERQCSGSVVGEFGGLYEEVPVPLPVRGAHTTPRGVHPRREPEVRPEVEDGRQDGVQDGVPGPDEAYEVLP